MTDDITRSLSLLAIDNVRMKADIIQLRDELKRQKENWAELCALNIRVEQQNTTLKDLKKKLTRCFGFIIVVLLVAISAYI